MIWIERFLFWMGTAGLTGSIATVILCVLTSLPGWKNSRSVLNLIKTIQMLYFVPVVALLTIALRLNYTEETWIWRGDFWTGTTPVIAKIFFVGGCIWAVGILAGIIIRIGQYRSLNRRLEGNVPVENKSWEEEIERYKKKYSLQKCLVYQNDLLEFPITVGIFRPMIVLPFKNYSEQQFCMIMEHEINHVLSKDLLWKQLGLWVTLLHWWNPLAYILLNLLAMQQEIECDIKTCKNSDKFTLKEYALFLIDADEVENSRIFFSALSESKKSLKRRLEGMKKGSNMVMPKRWKVVCSCLILSLLSVTPAYAASLRLADVQESWIYDTEIQKEVELERPAVCEDWIGEDDDTVEIDLTSDLEMYASDSRVKLDLTITAGVRMLYGYEKMQKGDKVTIIAYCDDDTIVYRIGIRERGGYVAYLEGSGALSYTFEIESAGEYTAFVQNMSDKSMDVIGTAIYPD